MKRRVTNEMSTRLLAVSENESLARSIVSAFCTQKNPTLEELGDMRCAVSEAVTNCIVHAYRGREGKNYIYIKLTSFDDGSVSVQIRDKGCGIADVTEATKAFYTTDTSGDRSGMGFSIMSSFTDEMRVRSKLGAGTSVTLVKKLSSNG